MVTVPPTNSTHSAAQAVGVVALDGGQFFDFDLAEGHDGLRGRVLQGESPGEAVLLIVRVLDRFFLPSTRTSIEVPPGR